MDATLSLGCQAFQWLSDCPQQCRAVPWVPPCPPSPGSPVTAADLSQALPLLLGDVQRVQNGQAQPLLLPADVLGPEQQPQPELTDKMNPGHSVINTIGIIYLKIADRDAYASSV